MTRLSCCSLFFFYSFLEYGLISMGRRGWFLTSYLSKFNISFLSVYSRSYSIFFVSFQGFEFHFPFLDNTCGIEISQNLIVRPLFKRFINIQQPTMCFIGLIIKTIVFPLVDLQVRNYIIETQVFLFEKNYIFQFFYSRPKYF